jgi:hypothetical protein
MEGGEDSFRRGGHLGFRKRDFSLSFIRASVRYPNGPEGSHREKKHRVVAARNATPTGSATA